MNFPLYRALAAKKVISLKDLDALVSGGTELKRYYLKYFAKKGLLSKIRNGLYAVLSFETRQPLATRFEIASKVTESSYVSYHGAFEYYGCANQVFNLIYVSSKERFESFSYDGIFYKFSQSSDIPSFSTASSPVTRRIVPVERAIVDSMQNFGKAGGLEEFLRCLALVPFLQEDKLLKELKRVGSARTYQKAGFIFSHCNDMFHISNGFLEICHRKSLLSPAYLSGECRGCSLDPKWKIYGPIDFESIIGKGIPENEI